MARLDGKVAIVLGAAGKDNMGQVIARAFADAGATVVVAGRSKAPLEALAAEIGGTSALADISVKADVDALFDAAVARHGGVHIAVNATGWGLMRPLLEVTEEELDRMVGLQFKGVHYFLAAAVRTMTCGGSIIQISSATTAALIDDHAAYIGTKSGGDSLVRCVANQYGAQGLRANSVAPGLTATPMTTGAMATPGLEAAFAKEYPLGRIGTAADVADACLWLASDGCFVTGQTLQVNGGLTLRRNPRAHEIGAAVAAAMEAGA